ncbi:MAG: hypothetical protein GY811_30485 [Myxococcales bacterium]|nr:hypothetical protein [Myxococcales bacterium]
MIDQEQLGLSEAKTILRWNREQYIFPQTILWLESLYLAIACIVQGLHAHVSNDGESSDLGAERFAVMHQALIA